MAKTKVKKSMLDNLSKENQQWLAEYEKLGWFVIFNDETEMWEASKKGIDTPIDPSDSFIAIMNMVENAELTESFGGNDIPADHVRVDADAKGNRYLPGTEPILVEELVTAAREYETVKQARMKLTAEEKEAKDALVNMAVKHEQHFAEGDDGTLIYHAAGITITRIKDVTEKIKTKFDEFSEDDE